MCWQIKKARSRPFGRNRAINVSNRSVLTRSKAILNRQNSGRDTFNQYIKCTASPAFCQQKRGFYKPLFSFCYSGIACLRVWILTKQQYSQTQHVSWCFSQLVWIPTKQQYSQTEFGCSFFNASVWIPTKQQYSQTNDRKGFSQ